MPQYSSSAIAEYYDRSQRWYTWLWSDRSSLALHYGYWEPNTRSHAESLLNQYREVQRRIRPTKNDRILDAGCGVGGASMWLAEQGPGQYIGLTLSPTQATQATKHISSRSLSSRVSVVPGSFLEAPFPDASFTKAFAIESACHTYPKPLKLYKEFYRLLEPGGTLVINDGVVLRLPRTAEERRLLKEFYAGFRLNGGCTVAEITRYLKRAGFTNITFTNKTAETLPSAEILYRRVHRLAPFIRLLFKLHLISETEVANIPTCIAQKTLLKLGVTGHGVFTATKPKR